LGHEGFVLACHLLAEAVEVLHLLAVLQSVASHCVGCWLVVAAAASFSTHLSFVVAVRPPKKRHRRACSVWME
jgi:hypothetical protein